MASGEHPIESKEDEELESELSREDQERLERAAQVGNKANLAATLSRRYLSVGKQALADSAPKRLDSRTRGELSSVLGVDPTDVRIHTGPQAEAAAEAFGARAFTMGTRDVFFGRDQFQPSSAEGQALLAHELTHVYEDSVPMAMSLEEDLTKSGPSRDGEEHAAKAEQAMYKEARRDKWLDEQEDQMAYGEISIGEKIVLVEKVYKLLRKRVHERKDRVGE
jgi:hypothetical protein